MNKTSIPLVVAFATTFLMGSFSSHCGGSRAHDTTPTAVAATGDTCPPPPCAEKKPVSAALSAKATARIVAAKKARDALRPLAAKGVVTAEDMFKSEHVVLMAVRDSGIVGADLVAATNEYAATADAYLKSVNLKASSAMVSAADVARAEYAVAEAAYWVEDAKR
jgi:hypothetical protein